MDFLAQRPGADPELLQVCADLSAPDTPAREARALEAAAADLPRARRRLVVLDRDDRALARARGLKAVPAYEWMLADGFAG